MIYFLEIKMITKLLLIILLWWWWAYTWAVIVAPQATYEFSQNNWLWALYYTVSRFTWVDRTSEWVDLSVSWALNLKDKAINAPKDLKDKVDNARISLQKVEDKVNEAKDVYDKTVEFVDDTSDKIDQAKELVDEIKQNAEEIESKIPPELLEKAKEYIETQSWATSTWETTENE